jgi:hypothetical protein
MLSSVDRDATVPKVVETGTTAIPNVNGNVIALYVTKYVNPSANHQSAQPAVKNLDAQSVKLSATNQSAKFAAL